MITSASKLKHLERAVSSLNQAADAVWDASYCGEPNLKPVHTAITALAATLMVTRDHTIIMIELEGNQRPSEPVTV